MWYWSVDNLLGQSRLRQTAIVNMYHVTKVSLNLSFTVRFNFTEISRFTPVLYRRIVWAGFYMLIFYLRISQFAVCLKRDSKKFLVEKSHFEPIVSKTMEYKICCHFGICWIHFTSQVGMAGLASGSTSPFVMPPPGTSAAPMVITGAPTSTGPGKEPNTFCLWLIG